MERDVDLMRDILLRLERLERSPPEPIFIATDDMARSLDRLGSEIETHLQLLEELGFVEGPGRYENGTWLFRRLTRKGRWLADTIRDARNWRLIKEANRPSPRW